MKQIDKLRTNLDTLWELAEWQGWDVWLAWLAFAFGFFCVFLCGVVVTIGVWVR